MVRTILLIIILVFIGSERMFADYRRMPAHSAGTMNFAPKKTFPLECGETQLVRVTVYWRNQDRWTRQGLTSSGLPLDNGKTCAVDPKIIPYGSKVYLPSANMVLTATDTGTDVKSRKAALAHKKNVPVVDIYFDTKQEAMTFAKTNPMFMPAVVVL